MVLDCVISSLAFEKREVANLLTDNGMRFTRPESRLSGQVALGSTAANALIKPNSGFGSGLHGRGRASLPRITCLSMKGPLGEKAGVELTEVVGSLRVR